MFHVQNATPCIPTKAASTPKPAASSRTTAPCATLPTSMSATRMT
jgi:hypothetical protein